MRWRARWLVLCSAAMFAGCLPTQGTDGPAQLQQAMNQGFGSSDGVVGQTSDGRFGYSVAGCGSFQVLVGAPGEPKAYLVSVDGGRVPVGTSGGGNVGFAVACADGGPIVGNPGQNRVAIGSQLTLTGSTGFGSALAVGRNGHRFVAVGTPEGTSNGVSVYSLDDGGSSPEFVTDAGFSSAMGSTVAAGDLNNDGLDDLVVGGSVASTGNGTPALWVFFAGPGGQWNASPLQVPVPSVPSALAIGELVATHPGNELAVGLGASSRVMVASYNGTTFTLGYVDSNTDAGFGSAVAIGAFQPNSAELFVGVPGRNQVLGYQKAGTAYQQVDTFDLPLSATTPDVSGAHFGFSLALLDLDNVPGQELVVGAPDLDSPTGPAMQPLTAAGAVFVFTYAPDAGPRDAGTGADAGKADAGTGSLDGGTSVDAGSQVDGGLSRCVGADVPCAATYCGTPIRGACVVGFCLPAADAGPLCESPAQVCDVFNQMTCIERQAAAFAATPLIGWAPLAVDFNATTPMRQSYLYRWDFGDGVTTDITGGRSTTHEYLEPGLYKATLVVDAPLFRFAPGYQLIEVKGLPHITSVPPPAKACREEWVYQPTATGVVTSWKLVGEVPPEMTIDTTTGRISWTDATPGSTTVNASLVLTGEDKLDQQPIALTVNCPADLNFTPCGCSSGAGPLLLAGLAWLAGRRRRA